MVGGDVNVYNLPEPILNPGGGTDRALNQMEDRRNIAFARALRAAQAEQRVILFFDHFEKATDTVIEWFRDHVLHVHRPGSRGFGNLWIVVAGRKVPLQHQADAWERTLISEEIGPLPRDDVVKLWRALGLDEAVVDEKIKESGANTKLLFLALKGAALTSMTESDSG
jgi:hypothetical protein